MQVGRIAAVVCLLAGMAVAGGVRVPNRTHRAKKMDNGIIATILNLLGLDNQISIPPG